MKRGHVEELFSSNPEHTKSFLSYFYSYSKEEVKMLRKDSSVHQADKEERPFSPKITRRSMLSAKSSIDGEEEKSCKSN